MKHYNNIRLITSFRQISNVFEIISATIRIFAFVLVILQGILLIAETKNTKFKIK